MTAATGTTFLQSTLMGAVIAILLAACQPADPAAVIKRVEAKWVDRQMLYVGDNRVGGVRVFHMRAAPQLVGELQAPGRGAVRDIALDPAANRIWVLGDGAVYLHDAQRFSLIRRIPAVGSGSERLALDASGRPLLIAADGTQTATIDLQTLSLQRPQFVQAATH
jgi:hypothetical protein